MSTTPTETPRRHLRVFFTFHGRAGPFFCYLSVHLHKQAVKSQSWHVIVVSGRLIEDDETVIKCNCPYKK